MTSSLEVGDLVSGWGRTVVLNGVSLTATPGSTLAVLGRNGAGKTTLFATLMGLTTLHGGMIRMGCRAIDALPIHRRARLGLGYVSQEREIFSSLTVMEKPQSAMRLLPRRTSLVLMRLIHLPSNFVIARRPG